MGASNRIHEEQLESSLPADLAQEYARISAWVKEIFVRYCDQVVVRVIDAASIEGFFKSLRYGVRKYPAVIVNQEVRFSGGALQDASVEIDRRLFQAAG
jgi:hypothetical protein